METPNNTNSQWWHDNGLRKLVFWQACILVSQMTVGYDESVVGSLQAMKPWLKAMDDPTPSDIGLITTVVFIGGFVGAFVAGPFADGFGRKLSMSLGSLLCVVGAAVSASAHGRGAFIAGRAIIGFGISFTTSAGPALLNELAHPRMRGRIAASFNVLWYLGSIVAAWLTFGTGHIASNWSWRIPTLVQGLPALMVLVASLFMPESPRYLCSKGKMDEAKAVLSKYHANGSANDELVVEEMSQITTALALEHESKTDTWRQMLQVPANRKCLGIAMSVAVLTLWNGQGVISYYWSPILSSVGITDTNQQTGINGGMQIWNLLCAVTGAWLAESVGRRPLWIASFVGMIAANVPLTITSARYDITGSKSAGYATVVFLFFYNAAFNLACNPLLYSYTTEILPYSIRARGLGFQIAVSQACLTVNQYVNPIALDSIGFWYFVFYLGMLGLGLATVYFCFPETKGRTLEELASLFGRYDHTADVEVVMNGVTPNASLLHDDLTAKNGTVTEVGSLDGERKS